MKKIIFLFLTLISLSASAQWKGLTGTWQKNVITGQYRMNFGTAGLFSPSDSVSYLGTDFTGLGTALSPVKINRDTLFNLKADLYWKSNGHIIRIDSAYIGNRASGVYSYMAPGSFTTFGSTGDLGFSGHDIVAFDKTTRDTLLYINTVESGVTWRGKNVRVFPYLRVNEPVGSSDAATKNYVDTHGGGGAPGGSNKQIQFNNSGVFAGNSNLLYDASTNSTYLNVTGTPPASGGDIWFYGTSITAGTGSTSWLMGYANQVALKMGMTMHGFGVSASTLEKRSPVDYAGAVNMIDRINTIERYNGTTDKYIVFEFGINDLNAGYTNYNPTNFQTDYTTVIDSTLARGWPANRIVIFSTTYQNPSQYGTTGVGGGTITRANQLLFNTAAKNVATSRNCIFVDQFNNTAQEGGILNVNDIVHPNNTGSQVMANKTVDEIASKVYQEGQTFAAGGLSQFEKIKISRFNFAPDSGSYPLAVDTAGRVGPSYALPKGFKLQSPILIGGMVQSGTVIPPAVGTAQDIVLNQGTQIVGSYNAVGDNPTYIKLVDGGANMVFGVTYGGAGYIFNNGFGGVTQALNIDRYQRLIVGSGVPDGPAGSVDGQSHLGDVVLPINGALTGTAGSQGGRVEPVGLSNHMYIRENSGVSSIIFAVSGGTSYNQVEATRIYPSGNWLFQKGGTFTETPSAILELSSTTQGFLPTRMTTTQRLAISTPGEALTVWDSTLHKLYCWDGSAWQAAW